MCLVGLKAASAHEAISGGTVSNCYGHRFTSSFTLRYEQSLAR